MVDEILGRSWQRAKAKRKERVQKADAIEAHKTAFPAVAEQKLGEIIKGLTGKAPKGLIFEIERTGAEEIEGGVAGLFIKIFESKDCLTQISLKVGAGGFYKMTAYPADGDKAATIESKNTPFDQLDMGDVTGFMSNAIEHFA